MKKFKFIDLFSGLGGFRLALENLGGTCVFSSDIDPYVKEVYKDNFGEYPEGDITKINENAIPDHDILCGGFPCQPFSIGGLRKGFSDTRGTLFFDVERIIRAKRPKIFFLENVRGLENHDKGNTLSTILSVLADVVNEKKNLFISENNLGYKVYYSILNSKDYNVPQNRERIYIIGFQDHSVNFKFPEKEPLKNFINDYLESPTNIEDYRVSNIVMTHIEKHLSIKSVDNDKDFPLIANEVRPSRCSFRNDGISPCLTAKMGTGGNNVPIVVTNQRKLTVRECLRIQGFPDSYKLKENFMSSYKAVGNSVSVPVISKVAKEIINFI